MSESGGGGPFDAMRAALQAELLTTLPASVARLSWSASRIEVHQRNGLRRLLVHATRRSPFHRRRLAGFDVERIEPAQLPTLPVMTKAEMMDSLDEVYTDPRLTPAIVEAALAATARVPVPILDEYVALSTGGSSGRRGTVVLDRHAAVTFIAGLTRSLFAQLNAQGGPPEGGLSIAMICAPSAVHATGSAPEWTAGARMPFRFVAVPATLPLTEIVDRLNALDAPGLAGYPGVLARLALEQRAGRLRIAPRTVSSTSETLHANVRAAIAEGFGVPIVDMFGSTEGLVGISAPGDDVLVFNSDVCIIELVDENNRPVPAGTPSAKVLVTNLANHVQPLVRYEMTDSFVRQADSEHHGHLRATVDGRSDTLLRYPSIDIDPIVVRSVLVTSPEVIDYQVHQTECGIDVAALATAALDADRMRERLTHALRAAGFCDPDVTVHTVATIERDCTSGKVRRFVPLGHP